MSDAREQSYYEIALTNRQVMSIFIVLLVCLLASFVSGVWIGRQGNDARVQVVDAQPPDGATGSGEAPVGEMGFFSDREAAPEPEVGEDPGEASASQSPPAQPPAAATTNPEPAEPEPATPEPTPAAAASGEFLYIQVFSGLDREQAQSVVQRLKNGGYAAFLSSVEVDNRLMHRVRIGPYTQRPEAEGVAGRVQREFKLSTWITR